MTKYILHGGATSKISEDNKKFFFEMINTDIENPEILCVYFSRSKKLWQELFEQDQILFSSASEQKIFHLTLADDETKHLTQQIQNADVVYLRGGDTQRLKDILKKVKNLPELFKNKVIGASSAGAYVLSTYYYTNTKDTVEPGLAILPIKTFCHYIEEKADKLEMLKKYGENLETYALPEEKFCIIQN